MNLLDELDVQNAFAEHIRKRRKQLKLSRRALAEKSLVPESTIKKFETTGQISLRQFLLLWQSVDDLSKLYQLTRIKYRNEPQTIEDVLNEPF